MSALSVSALFVLTGVSAYAAAMHLSAFRRPLGRSHVLFAMICLLYVGFGPSQALVYTSQTVADYTSALKWNGTFSLALILAFLWFISALTGVRPRTFLVASTGVYAMLILINILQPYGLHFSRIDSLKALQLPWGETITLARGRIARAFWFCVMVVLSSFGFALYSVGLAWRRGHRHMTVETMIAIALFLATCIEGILVRGNEIEFVQLGSLGVFALVIAMSIALVRETSEILASSERRYRLLVERSPFGIQILSPDGRTRQVNPAWEALWGTNIAAVRERSILDDQRLAGMGVMPYIERGLAGIPTQVPPLHYSRVDDLHARIAQRDSWVRMIVYPVEDSAGVLQEVILMQEDVTERKRLEEAIRRMAHEDYLTGLPNRAHLHERLREALKAASLPETGGALLLIDVDHFKMINDALGHHVGDEVLRVVAKRLLGAAGSGGFVARLGGDEFVVLISGVLAVEQAALRLAQNISETLESAVVIGDHALTVGASTGIALFSGAECSQHDVLRHADLALYRAKSLGRGVVELYQPELQADATYRLRLQLGLRHAVENGELALCYQAEVDSSARIRGAEVLLRWRHPQLGDVSPALFIAVAEESGLIHSIGNWVLEQTCARLTQWLRSGVAFAGYLAVNVSPWQFTRPNFVEDVRSVLRTYKMDPRRLMFELTESALLYDLSDTISKLTALRALGLRVALDDFGTGYSSLAHLRVLPLDQLKIDRVFVAELSGAVEHPLVESMIDIAKHMKLQVVAEGVENETQRSRLIGFGCQRFQGFLFCPPLTEGDFLSYVGS